MDEMLIWVLEQAIEVIGEKASDEQAAIENLFKAKRSLERLQAENKGSLDPIKDFLERKIREVETLTKFNGELEFTFDRVQELYKSKLVLQWLYDESYLRDLLD